MTLGLGGAAAAGGAGQAAGSYGVYVSTTIDLCSNNLVIRPEAAPVFRMVFGVEQYGAGWCPYCYIQSSYRLYAPSSRAQSLKVLNLKC
jgi:hypothetical protein